MILHQVRHVLFRKFRVAGNSHRSLTTNYQLPLKPLKTPLMNKFHIENEALNSAIIEEWNGKIGKSKKVDLTTMHLTTLAYESIDNPFNESQDMIVNEIIQFLEFDSLRLRSTDNVKLLQRQSRHWDPMVDWFEHQVDCVLPIEYGDLMKVKPIPDITREKIREELLEKSRWALVGLKFMSQNLKSYILATSLVHKFLTVQEAVDLSRLETKFQTERWSNVEWEHDIDEQCTLSRVAGGSLFYHLSI